MEVCQKGLLYYLFVGAKAFRPYNGHYDIANIPFRTYPTSLYFFKG